MSLEQAIHELWTADLALSAALPATRLFTAQAPGSTSVPYAVLNGRGRQTITRTSSGTTIDRALLRITCWTTTFEAGRQLGQALAARFDRSDFDLDEGRVLNMERLNEAAAQADDGAWRTDFDFAVTLQH